MSQSLTNYQFRQSLASLVKKPASHGMWSRLEGADGMLEDYQTVVAEGYLQCPVDNQQVSVIPERFPLFIDMRSKKNSVLLQVLQDRNDEAILAVDSVLVGKDAIHLVGLVETATDVETWMSTMSKSRMEFTLRPINDTQKLIIAPLSCFVPDEPSC